MEKKVCYIMEYIQLCNYNGEKGTLFTNIMLLMYNGVYTIM